MTESEEILKKAVDEYPSTPKGKLKDGMRCRTKLGITYMVCENYLITLGKQPSNLTKLALADFNVNLKNLRSCRSDITTVIDRDGELVWEAPRKISATITVTATVEMDLDAGENLEEFVRGRVAGIYLYSKEGDDKQDIGSSSRGIKARYI